MSMRPPGLRRAGPARPPDGATADDSTSAARYCRIRNRGRQREKESNHMPLSSRFEEALLFATRLHADQVRKGSRVPYVAHLLAVAAIVLEHGGTEDAAIAALRHDAVEDQGGAATRAEIRRRFGEAVVAIVDGCTDADVLPKPPWRARKELYIAHVRQAPAAVRLVSVADK